MRTSRSTSAEFELVDALLAAAVIHSSAQIRAALDTAAATFGLGRCVDGVLLPAIRRIALQQPADDDVQNATRLAVETVRAWLEALAAAAPAPRTAPPLVLACAPGDRHSVGLEALAVLLRYRHLPCRMLGGRVSARSVSIAVAANRPAGVVLVSQLESTQRHSTDLLRALSDIGVTTFYAGAAFELAAVRQNLPGIYLGTSLDGACWTIGRTLTLADAPALSE